MKIGLFRNRHSAFRIGMARHESDREDILREATALVVRAELSVPGENEPVVVGFRAGGAASIFFGGDPVYQFNTAGELRRAYVGGLLYKADRGRLVEMKRERTGDAVVLLSRELPAAEAEFMLAEARRRIAAVGSALAAGTAAVQREVPEDGEVCDRIRQWIERLPSRLIVANSPRVG